MKMHISKLCTVHGRCVQLPLLTPPQEAKTQLPLCVGWGWGDQVLRGLSREQPCCDHRRGGVETSRYNPLFLLPGYPKRAHMWPHLVTNHLPQQH